jgi:hypothetical protein
LRKLIVLSYSPSISNIDKQLISLRKVLLELIVQIRHEYKKPLGAYGLKTKELKRQKDSIKTEMEALKAHKEFLIHCEKFNNKY